MQVENQLGNCTIGYAAWSDQSLLCGKLAVARCADCGSSICSEDYDGRAGPAWVGL